MDMKQQQQNRVVEAEVVEETSLARRGAESLSFFQLATIGSKSPLQAIEVFAEALTRIKTNALSGVLDDYELSFESGERLRGKFLVARLDYAGDFNGERNYTLALESSGPVTSL